MRSIRNPLLLVIALGASAACLEDPAGYRAGEHPSARLGFVDWTQESGISAEHVLSSETVAAFLSSSDTNQRPLLAMASGIAVGDVDDDGWSDLFVLRGDAGGALFRNARDGTFEDVTASFGIETDPLASGPLFADFDGDGLTDLLLGGVGNVHVQLLLNVDGVRFRDATEASGLSSEHEVLAVSAGDLDGDGDLDVLLARYGSTLEPGQAASQTLWLNHGDARFSDMTELLDYPRTRATLGDAAVALEVLLAPSFADLDGDRDPDIALVQDQNSSVVIRNLEPDAGRPVLRAGEDGVVGAGLGRGSALGDYDNDGDLDWFVSGIDAPELLPFADGDGNHLFENDGDGSFRDVTEAAGVADGSFAWGSCFADFDNDGFLDLFQVNGWGHLADGADAGAYRNDSSRLFMNQRDGTFAEVAIDVGIDDRAEGRGVACFDYDHDGDMDIIVSNAGGEVTLWGNTLNPWFSTGANYVCVQLREAHRERTTVGSRVTVELPNRTLMREVVLGSFVSPVSTELHFGVGAVEVVDAVKIDWAHDDRWRIPEWPTNACLVATHLED